MSVQLAFASLSSQPIRGLDPSIVSISVSSLLDLHPSRGYIPLQVEVRNRMAKEAVWQLQFSSENSSDDRLDSAFPLAVSPQSVGTFMLYVPVSVSRESRTYSQSELEVMVQGPSSQGYRQTILKSPYSGNNAGKHVGISQSMALQVKEPLVQLNEDERGPFSFHTLDLNLFPQDAKGLSGLDILVLSPDEWSDPRLSKDVLHRWQALGGQVLVIGNGVKNQQVGIGGLLAGEGKQAEPPQVYNRLKRLKTPHDRLGDNGQYYADKWAFGDVVKEVKPSFGLFMLAAVVIALLLGPVNLMLGLKKKQVLRVIWTTPLWSLGLSLLVGVGIILSDGFGGKGVRSVWVMLLPEENLEVTLQEQVSRTGVLVNSSFTVDPDVRFYPVNVEKKRQYFSQQFTANVDGTLGGDWFANRRVQGQVIERVRSSRAQVTLTPSVNGSSMSVVSTVDTTFTRLIVQDEQKNWWEAEHVTPGKDTAMKPINRIRAMSVIGEFPNRQLHPLKEPGFDTGWFVGVTASGNARIETLSSIRWQDKPVVYTGPIVLRRAL
jgi:hypothetical protein